jgi:hypothetical protein
LPVVIESFEPAFDGEGVCGDAGEEAEIEVEAVEAGSEC